MNYIQSYNNLLYYDIHSAVLSLAITVDIHMNELACSYYRILLHDVGLRDNPATCIVMSDLHIFEITVASMR